VKEHKGVVVETGKGNVMGLFLNIYRRENSEIMTEGDGRNQGGWGIPIERGEN